jgi:hypothetical protein
MSYFIEKILYIMSKKPTKKELKKIKDEEDKIKLNDWKVRGAKKWGTKCEICGSDDCIQYHHFYPYRHHKELRYEVNNCVPLCRSHHFQLERLKRMDIAYQIIIKRGILWLKKLRNKLLNSQQEQ